MNITKFIYQILLTAVHNGDKNKLLNEVQSVRKVLSRHKKPPIDKMIDAGVVPLLVQLLDFETSEE